MKRLALCIGLLLLLLLPFAITAVPVHAAYDPFSQACKVGNNTSSACGYKGSNANPITGSHGVIKKASNIVAIIAGISAIIVIMIGGLQYIVSNGDSQKTVNARNAIIGGAVGLGIVVAAQSIILLVLSRIQ